MSKNPTRWDPSKAQGARVGRCIKLMIDGAWWTKRDLAEELDVSERSVNRYLLQIEEAGFVLEVRDEELDRNLRYFRLRRG